METIDQTEDDGHCEHMPWNDGVDWSPDDDICVHCDCCCTCLGCEYGPR